MRHWFLNHRLWLWKGFDPGTPLLPVSCPLLSGLDARALFFLGQTIERQLQLLQG
jgi:hypothetical protein